MNEDQTRSLAVALEMLDEEFRRKRRSLMGFAAGPSDPSTALSSHSDGLTPPDVPTEGDNGLKGKESGGDAASGDWLAYPSHETRHGPCAFDSIRDSRIANEELSTLNSLCELWKERALRSERDAELAKKELAKAVAEMIDAGLNPFK